MLNISYFVGFILYFIFCQYVVEKEKLPKKLLQLGAFKIMLYGILAILASVVIGLLLHIAVLLVTTVTLFVASVIAAKFRKVFTKIEAGKKV